jgi:hypothetical protein
VELDDRILPHRPLTTWATSANRSVSVHASSLASTSRTARLAAARGCRCARHRLPTCQMWSITLEEGLKNRSLDAFAVSSRFGKIWPTERSRPSVFCPLEKPNVRTSIATRTELRFSKPGTNLCASYDTGQTTCPETASVFPCDSLLVADYFVTARCHAFSKH